MLVVDHAHDAEEHHEQGGERQGFFESSAELVFFEYAVERGLDDDDHQADQAHFRPVKGQGNHQQHAATA